MDKYVFQKARNEDIDEILILVEKRIKWMDENNISQWNKTNYLKYCPKNYYEELVLKDQLYVVKYGDLNNVIGAFSLLEQDKFWDDSSQSYYIHNLVTDIGVPGIGVTIIRFCEQIAIKHGKKKIRLDCQASNHKLKEYYAGLGFENVGRVQDGIYTGVKLEKKLNHNSLAGVLNMDEKIKQGLFDKNNAIINMVIGRAKRDFPEDIAIIGLTGSFSTGDFHEKSDLDLIIINNTDRGWEIASCFILEDVGYDIYCTPWETRIEAEASLKSPMISCLVDLQILYCAKPEYLDKFNSYRQRALDALERPIGKECIERAKECINNAKQEYANTLLSDNVGTVRYAAGRALSNVINAIVNLNNTYFKRGIKRYLEQLATFQYIPDGFEKKYMAVVSAKTIYEIRDATCEMLKTIIALYDEMYEKLVKQPLPTYDNLCGTYEELWCNCRNKVIASTESKDKSYVYHVALGAQAFLNEMTEDRGTKKFDLMKHFDAENLPAFKEAFLRVMDEYLDEYNKVGRKVERYASLEELYKHFMKG